MPGPQDALRSEPKAQERRRCHRYDVLITPRLSLPWLVTLGLFMALVIIAGFEFIVDALYPVRPVRLSVRILYILRGVVLAAALVGLALFVLSERNAALNDDRRRLYNLLEGLPMGVCVVDPRGRPVFTNHEARGLAVTAANVGRGRRRSQTSALRSGTDAPYPSHELPLVRALAGEHDVQVRDMEVFESDGRRHAYQVFASPVTDRKGRTEFAVALFRDITEEQRRERDRSRLVAIVDSSSEAIIGYGPDGMITSWNRGAEEIYGYKADEVVGRSVFDLIVPSAQEAHRAVLRRTLAGERIIRHESRRVRKDGTVIPVAVSLSPVRDADGRVVGVSSVSRDITVERNLQAQRLRAAEREAQLRQMRDYDRVKRRFLDHAAHELKTPLTPLMLEVGMIERLERERGDPELQASVARLGRSARRLLRVTNQLIEVVRLEARVGVTDPVPFDLAHVADEVVDTVRHGTPPYPAIRRTGDPSAMVSGRIEEIRRTLLHLVQNAVKFSNDHGPIEVRVRAEEEGATVEVRDKGRGFTPEQAQQVFDPFTQFFDPGSIVEGGLGLGLYEARLIVEGHGGRIWAHSEGMGEGAQVGFYLPERPRAVADVTATRASATSGPRGPGAQKSPTPATGAR